MEISEEDLVRIQEKIEKLKQSKFKQQMLPAWRPVPSFGSTMIIFGIFGLIFLSLGITLYVMSERIQGIVRQYDSCPTGTTCDLEININNDIPTPVYVYYQLDNFYQNHRRYVKSRSNEQLMGNNLEVSQLDDCDPIKTNKDLGRSESLDGTPLVEDAAAFPCGLVAKSVFNDTFTLKPKGETSNIPIFFDDIAWKSDVDYKFKNLDGNYKSIQWADVEDRKSSTNSLLVTTANLALSFDCSSLYCLDANCWPSQLPQALGRDQTGPEEGHLLPSNSERV